jgi:hypothetical protein
MEIRMAERRETPPLFLIYPKGASFPGEPRAARLIGATNDREEALRIAGTIDGTVERWAHGQAIRAVSAEVTDAG